MVKLFEAPDVTNIQRSQLSLHKGELSGDLIKGGIVEDFTSTGIKDNATVQTLLIEDNKLTVKSLQVSTITSDVTVRGDLKIYGVLDVGQLRAVEVLTNSRHEKQFLEFANPDGPHGTGLLWSGGEYNKQLVYKNGPDRFWLTENIDIPSDRSYMIEGEPVISSKEIGRGVTVSNLKEVGTLKSLTVSGKVNIADCIFFNPINERVSIGTETGNAKFTIYDQVNDVEIILGSNHNNKAVIGTYNTKGLELVTDQQTRISVEAGGDITLGLEQKDSTVTRVYGKLSVGIKNPTEQFEVAGNIRWANRLFAVGNRPPESGNYQVGDTIWNSTPRVQGYIGWVCIVGGNPGQWKPFGLISE